MNNNKIERNTTKLANVIGTLPTGIEIGARMHINAVNNAIKDILCILLRLNSMYIPLSFKKVRLIRSHLNVFIYVSFVGITILL